jgi:hypothetical protein
MSKEHLIRHIVADSHSTIGAMQSCVCFVVRGNMENRNGNDRRKANPFGANGPWLTTGKMGGLVFTDRRKSTGRRSADRQRNSILAAE